MSVVKISIAMCTHNGESYVQEQLDSIAAQTRLPDELIICDDRSGDNTRTILETFASQAPFLVRLYTNEARLGSPKNFEKAISLCEGDIIALSDQDDVWAPEKLERIEAVFSSAPDTGLVFTDAEVVDENLRPLGYRLWQSCRFTRRQQSLIRKGRAFEVMLVQCVVAGGAMAFRSRFRELVLPIPNTPRLVHDMWIASVIAVVADIGLIDECLTKYRQHAKQQIGARKIGFLESVTTARKTDPSTYLTEADGYTELYNRLLARDGISSPSALAQLKAKMSHLQTRANLPNRRIRRVPLVLKELFTLHYHRYSRGLYSAAKDFLV